MLEQWVITHNPADFPGKYAVRRWVIGPGRLEADNDVHVADTIEGARMVVLDRAPDAYRLDRLPYDDPVIVEVWT